MTREQLSLDLDALTALIHRRRSELERPIVVGISGFAGSGKSTLVRNLMRLDPSMVRMRGDDFLEPSRSHARSADWDGVDRVRLVDTVLLPFREQRGCTFRRFDWTTRALGEAELVPSGDILLVDLIGLFHPEALPVLDISVWVDVPLDIAKERGMQRDTALGRNHRRLWNEVWIPNEIDFDANFRPKAHADVLYGEDDYH